MFQSRTSALAVTQLIGSRSLTYPNMITGATLESLYGTANSCSECFTNAFVLHVLSSGLHRSHQDSIPQKRGIVYWSRSWTMDRYWNFDDRYVIAVLLTAYYETNYHYVSPPIYSEFLKAAD